MTRTFFAPGKLILFGEYAVLEGAPALTAAVTRGVHIHAEHAPTDNAHSSGFRYEAPALSPGSALLNPQHPALFQGASELARLPLCVLETLATTISHPERLSGYTLRAELGDMMAVDPEGQSHKLGLGSSAASAVALTGTLLSLAGVSLENLTEHALEAHWRLQDGKGSGADVAASAMGGLVFYQRGTPTAIRRERVSHQNMPPFLPVFLGASASTTEMLGVLRAFQAGAPEHYTALMGFLVQCAHRAVELLERGGDWLALVRDVDAGLDALGQAAGLSILTPMHRELSQRARAEGLAVKPCGAGGGDFSLVFGESEEALQAFAQQLEGSTSLLPLPMQLSEHGFRELTAN